MENSHSASALSETVLNNENICNDKSAIDDVHKSTKRKRETSSSLSISPSKIPRLGSENYISENSLEGNIIFLFRLFNIYEKKKIMEFYFYNANNYSNFRKK